MGSCREVSSVLCDDLGWGEVWIKREAYMYTYSWFPGFQLVKIWPASRRPRFNSWVRKSRWRRDRLPTPVFWGFPGGSAGKESVCSAGDLDSIPGLGRSPGEGKGYPLLENSLDYIVHGVTNSWTRLSDFHFRCKYRAPITSFLACLWYHANKCQAMRVWGSRKMS